MPDLRIDLTVVLQAVDVLDVPYAVAIAVWQPSASV
jgi:hypothetical protein